MSAAPGTTFETTCGIGFAAAFRARRRGRIRAVMVTLAVLFPALLLSAWVSEAYPSSLVAGVPRVGDYFVKLIPDLRWGTLLAGPDVEGSFGYWMYKLYTSKTGFWGSWLGLLLETSQMAALATIAAATLALALCFPAANNLMQGGMQGGARIRGLQVVFRRGLELFRTVPDIVYALILVWAVGIGPLAGILAIMLHTTGALGKLFAEVVENADLRAFEGVRAAGGSWVQGIRYGIVPQVLPNFVSYVLLRFEINVRAATVIGFVGAGGIGQELYTVISFNYYQEISAILVLVVLAVVIIDLTSEWVRTRVILG